MSPKGKFNIRVYALLHNNFREILIAEEYHFDTFMRKFPGGGLDFGEGTLDCLFRELREELEVEVSEAELLHTTDFFVQSAFYDDQQVVAVYYLVQAPENLNEKFRETKDLHNKNGTEHFRWIEVSSLEPEIFTFPIDRQAIRVFLGKIK